MSFKDILKTALGSASQMLFPEEITCIACGNELDGTTRNNLCAECPLEYNKTFCHCCGRKIANLAELCDKCIEHGTHKFDLARSSVVFNDTAKKLIYSFKYGGASYLASYLAAFMAETFKENGFIADMITFVPLHKKRQRKRGYNQSELLAQELSKQLIVPCAGLLKKIEYTKNLARLNQKERAQIIKGTFEFFGEKSVANGKRILLVDDVLTTGATCDECAELLKKIGAKSVFVLTFASVQVKPTLMQERVLSEY